MGKPFEIVILSGKGGTGKTSITAAFASIAENAVFADCDVDAADLHLLLTPEIYHSEKFPSGTKAEINQELCTGCCICYDLCRFHAIQFYKENFKVDEYACEGCGLCVEACPANAISITQFANNNIYFANCRFGPMIYGKLGIAEENSGKLVAKIRQYTKDKSIEKNAVFIIADGPPGIGCPVISSVTGADLVIAVTEPTLSGWHDLQRLIEMIGRFRTPVNVIINKCDLNENMSRTIENNLTDLGIPVLGKLPYDDTIVHAMLEGKTINEFKPEGFIAKELSKMWKKILN